MSTALNTQTDREVRYVQRMEKKRVEQQNIDRAIRASNRNKDVSNDVSTRNNNISNEVSSEIRALSTKKRSVNTRINNSNVSYSSYFW